MYDIDALLLYIDLTLIISVSAFHHYAQRTLLDQLPLHYCTLSELLPTLLLQLVLYCSLYCSDGVVRVSDGPSLMGIWR